MASDYLQLIPSANRVKPRFAATVTLLAGAVGQVSDAIASLPAAFDVVNAVGPQLDAVGKWVGITRQQSIPLPNSYFAFDTPGQGWNQANWKPPYAPSEGIVTLDDETYRAVILAKIGANYWAGTNEALVTLGVDALADVGITAVVIDNMDMSVTVYVVGPLTAALMELVRRNVIVPKPAGVRVASYVFAGSTGGPRFALSVETTPLVAGLDIGSFGDPP